MQMMEQTMQPPWEVMRWWRSVASKGHDATGLLDSADGMETVRHSSSSRYYRVQLLLLLLPSQYPLTSYTICQMVRLLCHIDESWFRLYYYARTEAPDALQPGQPAGVPEFVDFIAEGVRATKVSWQPVP